MVGFVLAVLQSVIASAEIGPFTTADLYLVRVTAVKVPDHPRLFGETELRIDEVLIGPGKLKGTTAKYRFVRPSGELRRPTGGRYSAYYPHFAYPAAKGQSRYWWAESDGAGGWRTADFGKVGQFLPSQVSDTLLKADLKPDDPEAEAQTELVKALVELEGKRTRLARFAYLRELRDSKTKAVYLMADRTFETLLARPPAFPSADRQGTPPTDKPAAGGKPAEKPSAPIPSTLPPSRP